MQLPRVLRGSSTAVSTASPDDIRKLIYGGWQARAYDFYNELGEIHYAANFHARIGKLRFYIGRADENDEVIELPQQSGLLDPLGDINQVAETWGRQRFLGGESWAIEKQDQGEDAEWECLSPLELQRRDDGTVELKGRPKSEETTYRMLQPEEPLGPGECHLFRLWRAHPKNSYETDATMRAVLADCERLKAIRQKDISETRSRIPAGILTYPKRSFPPSPDDRPGQTPKSLRDLQESFVRPIQDPGDASAQVPFLVGIDGDPATKPQDLFRHVTLDRVDTGEDGAKEERSVIAIARGLDLPVEYLTGVGAINHWGQWFIEDQLWKSHLQPLAMEFCREWTEIYLVPLVGDPTLMIWYDEVGIVAQPDRSKDALNVFDRGGLSWTAMVEANGFTDTDMPDELEREEIRKFTKGAAPPQPGIGGTSGGTEQSPPAEPGQQNGAQASADGLAAYRAREVAGNRLVNLIRKADPELMASLLGMPRCAVPEYVGRMNAQRLTGSQTPEMVLLDGAAATYQSWLEAQGHSPGYSTMKASEMLSSVAHGLFDGAQ